MKIDLLRQKLSLSDRSVTILSLTVGLILWELGVRWLQVKPIILPAPSQITQVLVASWPTLLYHTEITVIEVVLAFAVGVSAAIVLGLAFHLVGVFRAALEPYLVLSQLVPKVALAPLLIIWFGFGIEAKFMIGALVCFFPTFINTFQGLMAHDADLALMMKCLRANRLTRLLRLQLPFAVPYIMAGLKSSALLSLTGCVIGEFVGSDRGLGFLLLQSEAQLDTPLLFAALSVLAAVGILFYLLPVLGEITLFARYMPSRDHESNLAQLV
jgi:NitT/TauT family transport system permease protein